MFWQKLTRPIVGLSPMDGITDQSFRYIQKKYGQPDVIFTEFTSVEGVCHGATQLLRDFLFEEVERPIVAQIYGTTPDFFRQTATLLCELGFDGIDLNMGCPAKNVAHSGAGAALIKTPKLAQQIIQATQQGVADWVNGKTSADCPNISNNITAEVQKRHLQLPTKYQQKKSIPVSIKTRIGFDQPVVNSWIPALLEMSPAAITIHGRTLKQHYSGTADWSAIAQAVAIAKNEIGDGAQPTLILGNGDVHSRAQAAEYSAKYGVDGVLIGRAALGNPFVFKSNNLEFDTNIFDIAIEHAIKYETVYGNNEKYNFWPMRKHLGWYVRGIAGASQIRSELFQANSSHEVKTIFNKYNLIAQ